MYIFVVVFLCVLDAFIGVWVAILAPGGGLAFETQRPARACVRFGMPPKDAFLKRKSCRPEKPAAVPPAAKSILLRWAQWASVKPADREFLAKSRRRRRRCEEQEEEERRVRARAEEEVRSRIEEEVEKVRQKVKAKAEKLRQEAKANAKAAASSSSSSSSSSVWSFQRERVVEAARAKAKAKAKPQ